MEPFSIFMARLIIFMTDTKRNQTKENKILADAALRDDRSSLLNSSMTINLDIMTDLQHDMTVPHAQLKVEPEFLIRPQNFIIPFKFMLVRMLVEV